MRIKALLLSTTIAFLISTPLMAMPAPLPFLSVTPSGKILYTLHVFTPNAALLNIDSADIYIGKGNKHDACKKIKREYHVVPSFPGELEIDNGDLTISSTAMSQVGKKCTCLKVNIAANLRTLSTGEITFKWNKKRKQFVSAKPSSGTMDFR